MNLHSEIRKIQIEDGEVAEHFTKEAYAGYKVGKYEMRESAAELSLKAEARIEELEEALKGLLNEAHSATKPLHRLSEWSVKAQKVLEKK